jgi:hypothetical protein
MDRKEDQSVSNKLRRMLRIGARKRINSIYRNPARIKKT